MADCEGGCMVTCLSGCQSGCQTCQTACEVGCLSACMAPGCQDLCESACMNCEACLDACQWSCQGCQSAGEGPTVNHWEWTSAEYDALTNNGPVSTITYDRWNDMCRKVDTVQTVAGVSWDSYYLTFTQTMCTPSDKTLTAARFNSLRYNVSRYYATGLPEVYTGDTVYGSYFVTLMSKVNDWIDSL